jgi:hypothetical protein
LLRLALSQNLRDDYISSRFGDCLALSAFNWVFDFCIEIATPQTKLLGGIHAGELF